MDLIKVELTVAIVEALAYQLQMESRLLTSFFCRTIWTSVCSRRAQPDTSGLAAAASSRGS
jgi:hypothetical protein